MRYIYTIHDIVYVCHMCLALDECFGTAAAGEAKGRELRKKKVFTELWLRCVG